MTVIDTVSPGDLSSVVNLVPANRVLFDVAGALRAVRDWLNLPSAALEAGTTVATLLASSAGPQGEGTYYRTVEGFAYREVSSSEHVTTAVGVKLRSLDPDSRAFAPAADGIADDTAKLQALQNMDGIAFLARGTYAAPSAMSGQSQPKALLADDATVAGAKVPLLQIADNSLKAAPVAHVFIEQNTAQREDPQAVFIQRLVSTDTLGSTTGKALRVVTNSTVATRTQKEWAISAELEVNNSNSGGEDAVAVSGVTNQYGTAGRGFGGHFQSKSWVIFAADTDVTAQVGVEINTPAVGLDHPTANNGTGRRRALDLIARTNEAVVNWDTAGGNDGDAEIGAAITIRSDDLTNGTFRHGIAITEGNAAIAKPIIVKTTGARGLSLEGANTQAQIFAEGAAAYGAIWNGPYTSGTALRIPAGQHIAMEGTNTVRTAYWVTASVWGFYSGASERVGFDMTASPTIRLNGTTVVTARKTGWAAPTGTSTRATFDPATVTLAELAQRVSALVADLTSHGLIGA